MSARVTETIESLIKREGGYVNHSSDKGGPTKYGITEKTARAHHYEGDMKDLPVELAKEIYLQEFWIGPSLDKVSERSLLIAEELFDSGVMSSPNRACKWLQLALNRMNQRARLYPDMVEDGLLGRKSMMALESYLHHRRYEQGENVLLCALNCLQGHHLMITAVDHHQPNEDFVFGWIKERVMQSGKFQ